MRETFAGFSWAIPVRMTMPLPFRGKRSSSLPYRMPIRCSFLWSPTPFPFSVTHELISYPDTLLYSPFPGCRNQLFLYTADCVFFPFFRYYSIWVASYTLPFTYMAPFPKNTDTHLTHTNQLKGLSRGDLLCNTALILRICCRWSVSQWSVPPFPLFMICHHPEVLSQDNNHICWRCDTIDLMWL